MHRTDSFRPVPVRGPRRLGLVLAGTAAAAIGSAAQAELVYGLTGNQTLVTWDSASPGMIGSGSAVSGLAPNEALRGIDFRPATGELFALGSFNNLYTINPMTGAASLVGAGNFAPGLDGSSFGFDFNPVIDRIRVVSEANQNLVLDPNDGTATGVTSLFYGPGDINEGLDPNVVTSGYTNSVPGAGSTQLYGIDTALDILVTQANSAGTLGTVGSLGIDLNDLASFDISGATGMAYLVGQGVGMSASGFWTIDLDTGEASLVGEVGGGATILSMAVVPGPGAAGLLGLALLGGRSRRRGA